MSRDDVNAICLVHCITTPLVLDYNCSPSFRNFSLESIKILSKVEMVSWYKSRHLRKRISSKTNRYTFHNRSNVRRQSFSDGKWKVPKRNKTTLTYNARHVGFRMSFFPKQNRRPKRKPMHDTLALEWFSLSRNV